MASIVANGVTIEYETHGDPQAPPVLLIMGLGMQLTAWPADFIDGLVEQGWYVIRFDHRDIGLSTKFDHLGAPNLPLAFIKNLLGWPLKSAYTLDDMAADALGLLDALGIAQAHVIGISMGGMIAQILAARHPDRVATLTSWMSSSGRRGLPGPSPAARRALLRRPDPRDRALLLAHMVHIYGVIGSPAYPTPAKLISERIEASLKRAASVPNNGSGTARQMVAIAASGDRSRLLKTIRCPALVIHGAADPLVPLAAGADTAALIPGAALHVIEGMGHDLPPQLIERLLALIDGHLHGKMARQAGSRVAH